MLLEINQLTALFEQSSELYCWTVLMTLEEVSFKFFRKLPAPPLIEEKRPPAWGCCWGWGGRGFWGGWWLSGGATGLAGPWEGRGGRWGTFPSSGNGWLAEFHSHYYQAIWGNICIVPGLGVLWVGLGMSSLFPFKLRGSLTLMLWLSQTAASLSKIPATVSLFSGSTCKQPPKSKLQ